MSNPTAVEALAQTLDDALERLRDYRRADRSGDALARPLPSLLEQCEAAVLGMHGSEPLRSIHHFACTGGTLISKTISALPNITLLSELDPLSEMTPPITKKMPFLPTDLIFALRHGIRPVDDDIVTNTFLAAVESAKEGLVQRGQRLILRDHAHSQFCREAVDYDARPTLWEMLAGHMDLLSVVTVRHPLDSFLSLNQYGWVNFLPATLDAYAVRYGAFLDRHAALPVVRYEDFVAAPAAVLEHICTLLNLSPSPFAFDLIPLIRMSGDSGRNDGSISARPRRPVPDEIETQRAASDSYRALCLRLEYEP